MSIPRPEPGNENQSSTALSGVLRHSREHGNPESGPRIGVRGDGVFSSRYQAPPGDACPPGSALY